jgi:hypothetical protein
LVVDGGVGIGGDVKIVVVPVLLGSLIITAFSVTADVVPAVVTAGTDTAVSTCTGSINRLEYKYITNYYK